jgi:hypothetical protein
VPTAVEIEALSSDDLERNGGDPTMLGERSRSQTYQRFFW